MATVLFLAGIFGVYMPWFNQESATNMNVGIAALFSLIGSLVAMVSVSKFSARYLFSVIRYLDYIRAAFGTSRLAQVWWAVLGVGWVGSIVFTQLRATSGVGLFATLMAAGTIGVGVTAVGVENKVISTAIHVRDRVARVFGAHPETVEAGKTGWLRGPVYTCLFPALLAPDELSGVPDGIQQMLPEFEVVGLGTRAVSLVHR